MFTQCSAVQGAQAKSVLGVNGALDFGPLAGDQPGGEGTGKVRGGVSRRRRCHHQVECSMLSRVLLLVSTIQKGRSAFSLAEGCLLRSTECGEE